MSFAIENWVVACKENAEKAWQSFLAEFNPSILKILERLTHDYDNKMDAYTSVIEKLKAQKFRKIIAYLDKDRSYCFEQWLAVVVRNCFFDWIRESKGRRRLPKQVESLSETDKMIFRLLYWEEFTLDVTYEIIIEKNRTELTFEDFLLRVETIRKEAGFERPENSHIFNHTVGYNDLVLNTDSKNSQPSSEDSVIDTESRQIFTSIIDQLSVQEQLVLKMHFRYGRTLQQISIALKISSIWKVHRILKRAIKRITKEMKQEGLTRDCLESHDQPLL